MFHSNTRQSAFEPSNVSHCFYFSNNFSNGESCGHTDCHSSWLLPNTSSTGSCVGVLVKDASDRALSSSQGRRARSANVSQQLVCGSHVVHASIGLCKSGHMFTFIPEDKGQQRLRKATKWHQRSECFCKSSFLPGTRPVHLKGRELQLRNCVLLFVTLKWLDDSQF